MNKEVPRPMQVDVRSLEESEKDVDSELRRGLLSNGRQISSTTRFLRELCCACVYFVGFLFILFTGFCVIFSIYAYLEDGAGERIRTDPESCTNYPVLYISFIGASTLGLGLVPCCLWCDEKDSAITHCWVGFQQITLYITMFLWVLEYHRISEHDSSCKTYVQEEGSEIFWQCCTILANIFLVALSFETFLCTGQCLSILFCTTWCSLSTFTLHSPLCFIFTSLSTTFIWENKIQHLQKQSDSPFMPFQFLLNTFLFEKVKSRN